MPICSPYVHLPACWLMNSNFFCSYKETLTKQSNLWQDLHPDPYDELATKFDILIKHKRVTAYESQSIQSNYLERLAMDNLYVAVILLPPFFVFAFVVLKTFKIISKLFQRNTFLYKIIQKVKAD